MKLSIFATVFAVAILCPPPAMACDDHVGTCELEAWRAHNAIPGILTIEGSATCDSGVVSIRLYDVAGGAERFLGTANGFIQGHALHAVAAELDAPGELAIRVSIDPM